MFGYLTANSSMLTGESLERYRGYYCGLCRSLGKKYGIKGKLTLNYDMTFLILLLGSIYEVGEEGCDKVCIAHPFKKHRFYSSCFTDYAADMNIALAYLKLADDVQDDHSLLGYGGSALLKRSFCAVKEKHPIQCAVMEESIAALNALEKSGCRNPDEAADTFGLLMESVLTPREDYWNRYLKPFGRNLGRFIYLLDACMDLEKDAKSSSFNVFSHRLNAENNGDYFRDILKLLLGDAAAAFDMLPCDRDRDIIDNILCFGVWTEFNKKYVKESGAGDVSGPV